MVEWRSCDKDGMAQKAYDIYALALYRKSLLTPVLGEELNTTIVSAGREQTKDWIESKSGGSTLDREAREGLSEEIPLTWDLKKMKGVNHAEFQGRRE